ncbi:TetR/AcrR family transcriptional regulator [Clostridium hydrogenum]|uniref:TetR/AcrR family transcriptional regulator n=1 Tax=Clostridium hydrogenum TaxID=2855764 RepID=UPI001F3EC096|nr:TetR/AcrR family transcriptional regulator [Clostridium hydrogenum]
MEKKIKKPTQKRSLEKYERIVEAAFKLFNEKGYFNTTTTDIAKEANIATGSVYTYFKDKKDIYIEVSNRIGKNIFEPTESFWEENKKLDFKNIENVKNIFKIFIKAMMSYHNFSKLFHDDMTALKLLDKDIALLEKENSKMRMKRTMNILNILDIPFKNAEASNIFLHYCNVLIDDVCHQILYDDSIKNADSYIEQAVEMLCTLLKNTADI